MRFKRFLAIALSAIIAVSVMGAAVFGIDAEATPNYNIKISKKEKYVSSREVTNDPEKEDITMILVIGQSNSTTEVGYPTELAAVKNGNRDEVSEVTAVGLEKNKVYMATYGKTISELNDSNDVATLIENEHVGGYSSSLGKKWNELTGEKVVIVQAAVGATCMHQWVKDGKQYHCRDSFDDSHYVSHYQNAVNQFNTCYNNLKDKYNIKHSFYVWNQGENDESNYNGYKHQVDINSKEKYFEAYKTMHEDLLNELPLDFGGINVVRSHNGKNSMQLTIARSAQYMAANVLPGCYMASRIFETCTKSMMQLEAEGSFGIHALQKTYNAVGTDAAINLYNAVTGSSDGLKSVELITDNDNYGVIKSRFNGKGVLVAGSDELNKGEKVSVAVSPCGDYTVSYSVDDDDTCVDDFGTPDDSVFEQNDTLNIALS
ncbi:MAG: sialate O-acetylesterase, partial [Acutalibacteraceae bacterium]